MTHRSLDWPPLQQAFAILDSKKRWQEPKTEAAVDVVQATQDGSARALKFYNFVCSSEGKPKARKALSDSKPDREIISFYIRYHYLLSQNDTTASNALIGTWQKELGHKCLWIDFNLEYQRGPLPASSSQPTPTRPVRASARKSTGCISAPKPWKRPDLLPRRKSAGWHYSSDSSLTPLPSEGEEDALLPNGPSFGSAEQSIFDTYPSPEVHMDSVDEPPPTPPQDVSVLIDPLYSEPENRRASLTEVVRESVDDPMNGTSASAACLRSGAGPTLSVTESSHPKSLSAPVPSSSGPRRKGKKRINYYTKKKPPKQKEKEPAEETTDCPMIIDTPTFADPEPEPEPPSTEPVHQDIVLSEPLIPMPDPSDPPSLNISIALVSPIVPEIRVPLPTSCANVPLPRSTPASIDPPPASLNGFGDTLVAAVPGSPRLPLPRNPPIWAQSRQELCESCDFFKAYQSGVYYCNGYAKGYLLSCFGAMRDIWHDGGRLIISHGGGKAASKLVEADHQTFKDASVNALVKNWQTKEPLVLIADDKYERFPFDLTRGQDGGKGYAYVVLGYYFIRHFWAEKHPADNGSGFAVRYKFAFQYCGEGDPWWTKCVGFPSGTVSPPATDGFQNIDEITCFSCAKSSPRIYEQGWMCLWSTCEFHFQLSGIDATTERLTYTEAFLGARPNPKTKKPAVRIPAPVLEAKNGIVTTSLFYHGWHCRRCGRLSCRTKWEHWECSSCGMILPVKGRIRDHKEFWGLSPNLSFEVCDVNPVSGITKIVNLRDQLGAFTFILPRNRGKIHLITGSARYNTEANEIFRKFQEHANNGTLPFRRFPMKAHICRGEFVTNYFSQNSGEPYQYVGAADKTLPFDQCPPCVLRALELIRTRAALMLGERPPFNELLTAAYMEKQSMGFHTDGERGLGPVVASLSMGSPAVMKFRTLEDRKTVVLTLVLRHGDVVIMEGATIQAVYEHTVCPIGFRIAVTAREIRPENWTEGAWR